MFVNSFLPVMENAQERAARFEAMMTECDDHNYNLTVVSAGASPLQQFFNRLPATTRGAAERATALRLLNGNMAAEAAGTHDGEGARRKRKRNVPSSEEDIRALIPPSSLTMESLPTAGSDVQLKGLPFTTTNCVDLLFYYNHKYGGGGKESTFVAYSGNVLRFCRAVIVVWMNDSISPLSEETVYETLLPSIIRCRGGLLSLFMDVRIVMLTASVLVARFSDNYMVRYLFSLCVNNV